jgi:hypothetical protein
MDQNELKKYIELYKDLSNQTLVEHIERVEIYKFTKEDQSIGERISVTEQEDIIEEIVDGAPMYYAGDVHVIDSPNFLVRLVKRSRKNVDVNDGNSKRRILR